MIENEEIIKLWKEKRVEWIKDPVLLAYDVLGIGKEFNFLGKPIKVEAFDKEQAHILRRFAGLVRIKLKLKRQIKLSDIEEMFRDYKGMSVQSGKGVGKTFLAAIISIWFFICFDYANVFLMGPSYNTVKTKLWAEISKWLGYAERVYGNNCFVNSIIEKQADLIFCKHVSPAELGNKWTIRIRTFPKNTDIESQKVAVQGDHEDHQLFVMDETAAIPNHICQAAEETCTEPLNLIFAIFNPNRATGWAIETQEGKVQSYLREKINAENSSRVTKEHIRFMLKKYGRDSNVYRVSVLGLKPIGDTGALIPWEWIQDAKERWEYMIPDSADPIIHSEDMGAGGDASILCRRHGMKVMPFEKNTNADTDQVGDWFTQQAIKHGAEFRIIDMNGVGNTAFYKARSARLWKVTGVYSMGHSPTDDCERLRDYCFWKLREEFQSNLIAIPPDDDELEAELSLLTYTNFGKIKVISKANKEFKQKMMSQVGYSSPGKADTLAYSCVKSYDIISSMSVKKKSSTGFPSIKPEKLKNSWMAK